MFLLRRSLRLVGTTFRALPDNRRQFASTSRLFSSQDKTPSDSSHKMENKKEDLRTRLTPLQYQVTQEAATERPFSGCYNKHYEPGFYRCIVCHQTLFSSKTKYDSGCGWPAFNDVLEQGKVTLHRDASIPGMERIEVRCSKCSAHMGHVFDDGPLPTGKRFCINSASIDFVPEDGGNILLLIKHPERIRTEVRCAKCGGHMGHVFDDGPKPTKKRYCINSAAIDFVAGTDADQSNNDKTTAS